MKLGIKRYIPQADKAPGYEDRAPNQPKPIKQHQWAKIANMLKIGGTIEDAAAIARISTGRLLRNIEAETHLKKDVQELMSDCKRHHLQRIYDGDRGWQSSAWFLERVYRKQYSLVAQLEGDQEKAIQMRKIVRKVGVLPSVASEN